MLPEPLLCQTLPVAQDRPPNPPCVTWADQTPQSPLLGQLHLPDSSAFGVCRAALTPRHHEHRPWGEGRPSGMPAMLPFAGKARICLLHLKSCASLPGMCVTLTLPLWCHLLQGVPPAGDCVFQDSGSSSFPPPSGLPPAVTRHRHD